MTFKCTVTRGYLKLENILKAYFGNTKSQGNRTAYPGDREMYAEWGSR